MLRFGRETRYLLIVRSADPANRLYRELLAGIFVLMPYDLTNLASTLPNLEDTVPVKVSVSLEFSM